jgi:hypothetical protein
VIWDKTLSCFGQGGVFMVIGKVIMINAQVLIATDRKTGNGGRFFGGCHKIMGKRLIWHFLLK